MDLEGIANHRGSTFGQMPTPQPAQIDFENSLSIALLRLLAGAGNTVYLEDEGRLVGRVALPDVLREKMVSAPILVVEEPLEARIDVVIEDYVLDLGRRYALRHAEDGARLHCEKLRADLARLRKRLGGARQQEVDAMMVAAFEQQGRDGDLSAHRRWIGFLLEEYYDPMYEYQLARREGECLFRGDRAAVIAWAEEH